MSEVKLTATNFEEKVISHDGVALVDFWAPWCGPCQMLGPVIEELAAEMESEALIGKLNVDENREVALKYSVRGIPTVILFKNGQEVERAVGVRGKDFYRQLIQQHQ